MQPSTREEFPIATNLPITVVSPTTTAPPEEVESFCLRAVLAVFMIIGGVFLQIERK